MHQVKWLILRGWQHSGSRRWRVSSTRGQFGENGGCGERGRTGVQQRSVTEPHQLFHQHQTDSFLLPLAHSAAGHHTCLPRAAATPAAPPPSLAYGFCHRRQCPFPSPKAQGGSGIMAQRLSPALASLCQPQTEKGCQRHTPTPCPPTPCPRRVSPTYSFTFLSIAFFHSSLPHLLLPLILHQPHLPSYTSSLSSTLSSLSSSRCPPPQNDPEGASPVIHPLSAAGRNDLGGEKVPAFPTLHPASCPAQVGPASSCCK